MGNHFCSTQLYVTTIFNSRLAFRPEDDLFLLFPPLEKKKKKKKINWILIIHCGFSFRLFVNHSKVTIFKVTVIGQNVLTSAFKCTKYYRYPMMTSYQELNSLIILKYSIWLTYEWPKSVGEDPHKLQILCCN